MEEKSMTRVPGRALARTPSSAVRTSVTSGESGTMMATTSASVTASATEEAAVPPAAPGGSGCSGLRLCPPTLWPAFCRWTAIGLPMMPRPMKAMVLMTLPFRGGGVGSVGGAGSASRALLAREPGERVGVGGLVLQTDRAGVAGAAQVLDPPLDRELAAAGGAAAGGVGDLHVGDPLGIGGEVGVDVGAVDRQVVDVEEEAEVRSAVLVTDAVEDGDDVGGGAQRVAVRARDRLEEHRPAHTLDGPGREREVLRPERVLRGGVLALHPVPVQGVEGAAPGALTDPGDDVEVLAQLGRALGPRDQPAVATGHVAGVEVETGQLHPGVAQRRDEGVDLVLGRGGRGEGPPELHAVETRGLGGGGPLVQGEVGEQDRAVDGVRDPLCHPRLAFRIVEV